MGPVEPLLPGPEPLPTSGPQAPPAATPDPGFRGGMEPPPAPDPPPVWTGGMEPPPPPDTEPPIDTSHPRAIPPSSDASSPFPHRPARSMAIAMLAAGLVLGIVGGSLGALLFGHSRPVATVNTSPTAAASQSAVAVAPSPGASQAASSLTPEAIYKQASLGVVTISSVVGSTFRSFGEATGSGIVLDTQGNILTNEHVVANTSQTQVTFSDGSTVSATVVGVDASDDLAIVKVSVSSSRLHPLTLADSDAVQVGDSVLAIGAPFGLSESLTAGIVSGLNRSSSAPNGRALTGLIQTDAPINPGNSGGPLLNAQGQVIGIDESIQSPIQGSVGVGFAVASNTAKGVLSALEKGQSIQHASLGIEGQTITPATAQQYGLAKQSGVLVIQALSGSPAAQAGLQGSGQPDASDDIITAIDGHPVNTIEDLTRYLNTKHVGDRVTLTVIRGGKSISVGVTLGNFQPQPSTGG
ncbi:MAG TPA: trypsin-like peptidase domain-containing protein [Candidatus Limnocylindrales bacterium]|nr:trypsin-like peptidase domain-containing protein [Candidatus Limnocylindrales bacterium]